MARSKCPSCGAPYNGRKCKQCYYVRFTEEIAHGLHTHEGEPLVIDAPVRKPLPRRQPFGCDRRTRRMPKWLSVVITWILVINLVPWCVMQIQGGIDRARVPAPVVSRSALKLWEGENITVWTDRRGSDPMAIPILVENNSHRDVALMALDIFLNGDPVSESFLYVEAGQRSMGRGYLYLDEAEVEAAGSVGDITLRLEIYDSDSRDTIALIDSISIPIE